MTIGYLPVPGTWGEQRAGVQMRQEIKQWSR